MRGKLGRIGEPCLTIDIEVLVKEERKEAKYLDPSIRRKSLDQLSKLAEKWQLEFNSDKCDVWTSNQGRTS